MEIEIIIDKKATAFQDWIVIEDEEDETPCDFSDILQPVAVLDGQSIARVAKFLYLSPEEKLSKALNYYEGGGFKAVIFYRNRNLRRKE